MGFAKRQVRLPRAGAQADLLPMRDRLGVPRRGCKNLFALRRMAVLSNLHDLLRLPDVPLAA
ncbi:MAG TPA: hypothetical protein VN837_21540 [Chloroflexota bacterium]|nr:hypothetical protein [Chloroflexota bacterium]